MNFHFPPMRHFAALALVCASAACVASSNPTIVESAPVAPTIARQPISIVVFAGDTIRLSVAASGTAPLAFQWYKDSVAIAGATQDSLHINGAALADSGTYYVSVKNLVSSVSSDPVFVSTRPKVSSTAWWQDGGAAHFVATTWSSAAGDESAVLVRHGGELTLEAATINKSGATSSSVASRDAGQNAAVLGAGGSRIYSSFGVFTSNGDGSAGLYVTDAGTLLQSTSPLISTLGTNSPAIGASSGATVKVTGGSLTATLSDAISVSASNGSTATTSVTLAGGTTVSAPLGTLAHVVNHAIAAITFDGESLIGNVTVDAGSRATLTLQNGTTWFGTLRGASLTLGSSSQWTLTGASAAAVVSGAAINGTAITNIIGNGFTVTYDATLAGNAALTGRSFSLAGGGTLKPQ